MSRKRVDLAGHSVYIWPSSHREASTIKLDIVQIAYHVTDIRRAAQDMAETFGAGPFFLNENIRLSWAEHRGQPADFVHSSAFGQWGDVMVEVLQQEDDSTNTPYRDMFSADEEGLHHTAIMVTDMNEAIDHFERRGMPLATRCKLFAGGGEFAFIDARTALGHMIEIYPASDGLRGFFNRVREASVGWSGDDPIRKI